MAVLVQVDAKGAIDGLTLIQQQQLPYALARALTTTAKTARDEGGTALQLRFTLRNRWVMQNLRVEYARKQDIPPTALIHEDADFMYAQEFGGIKIPHKGHNYMAVPVLGLRGASVIPLRLRPQWLLGDRSVLNSPSASHLWRVARSARAQKRRTAMIKRMGDTFGKGFIIRKAGGKLFIWMRTGQGRSAIKPMYRLMRATNVPPRWGLEEIVRKVAARDFKQNFADAMRQAVATAK